MLHIALSTVLALTLALAATAAQASTIDVRVLTATYSVTVAVHHPHDPVAPSKTATSSSPISESLFRMWCEPNDLNGPIVACESVPPGFYMHAEAEASATADLLELSALAHGYVGITNAGATADSEWTFSPLADGTADFEIFMSGFWIAGFQSASLFDVTANQVLWEFSTRYCCDLLANTRVAQTPLSAQHVYAMHLNARAGGQGDTTLSTLRVTGLRAVPDNVNSFVCLCMGLLLALVGKWTLT